MKLACTVTMVSLACEQALLFWARLTRTREWGAALGTNLIPLRTKPVTQTKRVPAWPVINRLCFPERHFSANGISLRLSEVQMKFYERSLQALLSSAPRCFAARSRVLSPNTQIGELARRLWSRNLQGHSERNWKKKNKQTNKKSAKCSNRMALKSLMRSNLTNGSYKPYMNLA